MRLRDAIDDQNVIFYIENCLKVTVALKIFIYSSGLEHV